MAISDLQIDTWVWGQEKIIWGYDPSHAYTFKILEPKKGRAGCMSLQYHHEKSESWLIIRGVAWALFIVDGVVCTKILRPGDVQNIHAGTVHRVMGVSDDLQIAEPSTPDRHAADKTVKKDVVRLHCMHGRPCDPPRDEAEAKLVALAAKYSEEAANAIDRGEMPIEHNPGHMRGRGSFKI